MGMTMTQKILAAAAGQKGGGKKCQGRDRYQKCSSKLHSLFLLSIKKIFDSRCLWEQFSQLSVFSIQCIAIYFLTLFFYLTLIDYGNNFQKLG